jgi:hypothetical protein
MKNYKGGIVAMVAVLLVTSLLVMSCSKKDDGGNSTSGSTEAKAAAALLKSLGGGDAIAMEKTLEALSPAVLAELTGNSGSPGGDFSYDLNEAGDGIIIKKYSGSGGVVVIPSTIEDYSVVSIAGTAFTPGYSYQALTTSLSTVTRYQEGEIGCNAITSVVIPEGVTFIGNGAFRNCENLSSIILPSSLKTVGDGTFAGCKELYNLVIPEGITVVKWLDQSGSLRYDTPAFEGCGKLKLATRQKLKDLGYTGKF